MRKMSELTRRPPEAEIVLDDRGGRVQAARLRRSREALLSMSVVEGTCDRCAYRLRVDGSEAGCPRMNDGELWCGDSSLLYWVEVDPLEAAFREALEGGP